MNAFAALRTWFTESVFRRVFKNAALMLTGRTTTGLFTLGTLSLSAHGLGVEQFGILVLVQTYGQVITSLATFQSWQAVIRYGAIALEKNNTPALQALLKLTTLLDVGGGLVGVAVGYFAAPLVGPHLGWSDDVIRYAQLFSLHIFFTAAATPTGLLRLFDRFDLLAVQTTITPLFRLIGVALTVALGAPFWAYLAAWFVASIIGGVLMVYLGWREAYKRGRLAGFNLSIEGITVPHGGVLRFSILSNFYTAQQVITGQMSTILVGALAGPVAAGIFKIGRDVATALSKPAELLNQSIYPEFARLGSKGDWHHFARLILRGAAVAAGAGAFMTLVTVFIGSLFLQIFFGPAFTAAYWPLVLLVASAALTIVGFPMDPALFAMGRAGIPLRVSTTVIAVIYIPALVILTRLYGPVGAGIATLATAAATVTGMSFLTVRQLRKRIANA
jgi:O-antigen/teichoic acid export membrane protein